LSQKGCIDIGGYVSCVYDERRLCKSNTFSNAVLMTGDMLYVPTVDTNLIKAIRSIPASSQTARSFADTKKPAHYPELLPETSDR